MKTKTDIAQYDVAITLAGTDNGQLGSKNTITVRVPAASPELAEEIGRALGNAINEGTDRIVCWPLGTKNIDVQPVVRTVNANDVPDEEIGPREGSLRREAKRLGFPISEADLDHARHVDNCARCQEEEKDRAIQYHHEQCLENSRHALLGFLFQVQETLKILGRWGEADKPLPPAEEILGKLNKAARKTSAAQQRALRA